MKRKKKTDKTSPFDSLNHITWVALHVFLLYLDSVPPPHPHPKELLEALFSQPLNKNPQIFIN